MTRGKLVILPKVPIRGPAGQSISSATNAAELLFLKASGAPITKSTASQNKTSLLTPYKHTIKRHEIR